MQLFQCNGLLGKYLAVFQALCFMGFQVNISECDLLVDLAVNSTSAKEPNFSLLKNRWETVYSRNFLFASK